MNNKTTSHDMSTMLACWVVAKRDGYTEEFIMEEKGLKNLTDETYYTPAQVKVKNFYRFEGASDPEENSILYLVETTDGKKGTIADAYGAYANPLINSFMQEVIEFEKKEPGSSTGIS